MMSTSVWHGRPSAVAAAAMGTAVAAEVVTQAVEGATFVLALAVVASSAVAAAVMGIAVVVTQLVEGASYVLALAVVASSALAAAAMGIWLVLQCILGRSQPSSKHLGPFRFMIFT